jgi:type I restriction enzyme S subunit
MNSIVVPLISYTITFIIIANEIVRIAMGTSTMPMLSKTDFEEIELIKPADYILFKFEKVMKPIQ